MSRSERLLARSWERAHRQLLQKEGFLEDALAAALEEPIVWERLIAHVGWTERVPAGVPSVTTQDRVTEGRTDITLTWPSGHRIALELKTDEPPSAGQIEAYMRSGLDVIAVAKLPAHIKVADVPGRQFLGVITWSRIRELDWKDAPLELRQLHQLLDATKVIMPKISQAALEGLVLSWNTWEALQEWARKGMEAAKSVIAQGGLQCVHRQKPRERVSADMTHERLVWWMWPPPWQDDCLAIYAGLFMGRPLVPVTQPSLPDLMLALHVNPTSRRGILLRTDAEWTTAASEWTRQPPNGVLRELLLGPADWEMLRCRSSSLEIVDAADPGEQLVEWTQRRAQEWVDAGIVGRLAELLAES
ncbi:hypothetical protein [Sorangium sp. So ce1099]|uniref:hypothetical protein n=1 Tax=Sorangium sp. So ce1099 TaxID=3133331 RepID=UPI003F616E81